MRLSLLSLLLAAFLTATADGQTTVVQRLAIPSYFYPCTGAAGCYWDQLDAAAPAVGLAIINPASGPGASRDLNYANQAARTQSAGIIVLGYVHTSYGDRASAAVKSEVDLYYTWYAVDGIFFDEVSTNCALQSYYQDLHDYVKAHDPIRNEVALNPGTNTQECYLSAADILLTFESSYASYLNWQPSGWEDNYPAGRFWHLVYGTTNSDLRNAINLSKNRHVGWVYVTPDSLPNPWDTLPTGLYWNQEVYLAGHSDLSILSIAPFSGHIRITGGGIPETNFSLQASPDLNPSNFAEIGAHVPIDNNGNWQFDDLNSPNFQVRFYRASSY